MSLYCLDGVPKHFGNVIWAGPFYEHIDRQCVPKPMRMGIGDPGTMSEYIDAYARIEPLLTDYDRKLQQYSGLCNAARQRDQKRRLINIQRVYNRYDPEVWRNTSEIIELVRQVNEVIKKEASVIRDMASLPAQEQVQFWHEEFMPLAAQEHALREKLLLVGQRVSPERTTQ